MIYNLNTLFQTPQTGDLKPGKELLFWIHHLLWVLNRNKKILFSVEFLSNIKQTKLAFSLFTPAVFDNPLKILRSSGPKFFIAK